MHTVDVASTMFTIGFVAKLAPRLSGILELFQSSLTKHGCQERMTFRRNYSGSRGGT